MSDSCKELMVVSCPESLLRSEPCSEKAIGWNREASFLSSSNFRKDGDDLLRKILTWDDIPSSEITRFLLFTDHRVLRSVFWRKTQTGLGNFPLLLAMMCKEEGAER